MNYLVFEFQTSNGTTSVLQKILSDPKNKLEAESEWHDVMKYAAISTVETHGAVMLTQDGKIVMTGYYNHPVSSNEEPEPET